MLTTADRMPFLRPERWEPLRDLDEMGQRLRRLFDESLHQFPALAREGLSSPHFDLVEADDAYRLEIELPGMKREDITLELVGNENVCKGEVKEREDDGVLRRQTRRTGSFHFAATLPDALDPDKVEAELADGVLKVRVPKAEPATHRTIEVKAA